MAKTKRTNNDLQNTTRSTQTPLKPVYTQVLWKGTVYGQKYWRT